MSKTKGRKSLKSFWQSKIATWRGVDYAAGEPPAELLALHYQEFSASGLDHKGQISSGYGKTGKRATVKSTFDAGSLILPGLLTASISLTGEVTGSDETLLVLQRLPAVFYRERVSDIPLPLPEQKGNASNGASQSSSGAGNNGAGQQARTLPPPAWQTSLPVALTVLEGRVREGKLQVEGTADLSLPVAIDELGVALSANGKLAADVQFTLVSLRDALPSYYPSPNDKGMALKVQLELALEALIGSATKSETKKIVDAWLQEQVAKWIESRGGKPPPSLGRQLLSRVLQDIADKAKAETISAGIDEFKSRLGEFLEKFNVTVELPFIDKLVDAWQNPKTKTKDLLGRLQSLKAGIAQSPYGSDAEKKRDQDQIDAYISLLQRAQAMAAAKDYKSRLSFLNLYSTSAAFNAGAQTTATVAQSATTPLAESAVELTLGATADANSSGKAQIVGYRYQTFGDGGGNAPLIVTQDTYVTYRQVQASLKLGFEAELTTEFAPIDGGTEVAGAKSYCSMTYQSLVTYWLYPTTASAPSEPVTPGSGSGVVFGCSASLGKLIRVAKAPTDPKSVAYLRRLANQLRLDATLVGDFLTNAALLQDIDPNQPGLSGLTTDVFLEASFAFDNTVRLNARRETKKGAKGQAAIVNYVLDDPFKAPTVKTFMNTLQANSRPPGGTANTQQNPSGQSPQQPDLEALRLRFRIADFNETIEPLFRLGFTPNAPFVLNVDITKVRGAGHQGFLDITQWYNNSAFNEPANLLLAAERSVPAVALLHQ